MSTTTNSISNTARLLLLCYALFRELLDLSSRLPRLTETQDMRVIVLETHTLG
jgi:hypothetical protein